MCNEIRYEYDAKGEVLIKFTRPPKIIKRDNLVWKYLGSEDEQYRRAIYLGQGCWECLDTISEEKALGILKEWGYTIDTEESWKKE